jgi:hypothetical protein
MNKLTQSELRMQMLAGIITEGEYKEKIEEEIGDITMTGMKLIRNLTPEIEEKIKQLQQEYPSHKINITSNSSWRPDRPDLRGTYTLSYSGPQDKQLSDLLNNLK